MTCFKCISASLHTPCGLHQLNLNFEKKHYPYWCQDILTSVKRKDVYAKTAEESVSVYVMPDPDADGVTL